MMIITPADLGIIHATVDAILELGDENCILENACQALHSELDVDIDTARKLLQTELNRRAAS